MSVDYRTRCETCPLLTYLSLFVTACQDFLETKFLQYIQYFTGVMLAIICNFQDLFTLCMYTVAPSPGKFENFRQKIAM